MYVDEELVFHEGTLETTVADHIGQKGSTPADAIYDTGTLDIGEGEKLTLVTNITTTVTSAGAATVTIQWVESANADLSSHTVLQASQAIPKATLVAGYVHRMVIPKNTKRYVGVIYTVGTAALTAGAADMQVVKDAQTNE